MDQGISQLRAQNLHMSAKSQTSRYLPLFPFRKGTMSEHCGRVGRVQAFASAAFSAQPKRTEFPIYPDTPAGTTCSRRLSLCSLKTFFIFAYARAATAQIRGWLCFQPNLRYTHEYEKGIWQDFLFIHAVRYHPSLVGCSVLGPRVGLILVPAGCNADCKGFEAITQTPAVFTKADGKKTLQ
jgi:hypothetical protein